jgi:hypothetical protein
VDTTQGAVNGFIICSGKEDMIITIFKLSALADSKVLEGVADLFGQVQQLLTLDRCRSNCEELTNQSLKNAPKLVEITDILLSEDGHAGAASWNHLYDTFGL